MHPTMQRMPFHSQLTPEFPCGLFVVLLLLLFLGALLRNCRRQHLGSLLNFREKSVDDRTKFLHTRLQAVYCAVILVGALGRILQQIDSATRDKCPKASRPHAYEAKRNGPPYQYLAGRSARYIAEKFSCLIQFALAVLNCST